MSKPLTPIVPLPFGALAARVLDDGRMVVVYPLLFDRARLCVGVDDFGCDNEW